MGKSILFIGPYRQSDGWGDFALDYIRSLLTTYNAISISPVYMSNQIRRELPQDIDFNHLENNAKKHYDITIQHVLPPLFTKIHNTKNIGICQFDTYSIDNSYWEIFINQLDTLIVNTTDEASIFKKSKLYTKIKCVPRPINLQKFDVEPVPRPTQLQFYNILENTDRDNLDALLIAFYREFKIWERASLYLYSNNPSQTNEKVEQLKTKLRLFKDNKLYKPLHILPLINTDEIHQKHHCFISTNMSVGLSLNHMEAVGFNNQVIVNGFSTAYPVLITNPPLKEIYNGRNTWKSIHIDVLQKKMRRIFNMFYKQDITGINSQWYVDCERNKDLLQAHSYKFVGERLNDLF